MESTTQAELELEHQRETEALQDLLHQLCRTIPRSAHAVLNRICQNASTLGQLELRIEAAKYDTDTSPREMAQEAAKSATEAAGIARQVQLKLSNLLAQNAATDARQKAEQAEQLLLQAKAQAETARAAAKKAAAAAAKATRDEANSERHRINRLSKERLRNAMLYVERAAKTLDSSVYSKGVSTAWDASRQHEAFDAAASHHAVIIEGNSL